MRAFSALGSVRALGSVVEVLWWLSIAVVVILAALIVLLATHITHAGSLSVTAFFGLDRGAYHVSAAGLGATAQIGRASGQISFTRPGTDFVLAGAALLAVAAAGWLVVLALLRGLLGDLRAGALFARANRNRVQRIGLAVLAFELMRALVVWGASLYLVDHVRVRGLTLHAHFGLNVPVLLVGLVLLVLAAAFGAGEELQEDRDLTI